jgi:hypothetical protein
MENLYMLVGDEWMPIAPLTAATTELEVTSGKLKGPVQCYINGKLLKYEDGTPVWFNSEDDAIERLKDL